jgi:hypothetical protein
MMEFEALAPHVEFDLVAVGLVRVPVLGRPGTGTPNWRELIALLYPAVSL